ncbi:MAG: hypothetical protein ACXIVQ_03035 [Acidimicrobiales bacterium]
MTTERPSAETRATSVSWLTRVVVALAIVAIAFEQSPANEALRANVAFRVLDRTGDAPTVGLVVVAVTLVIEGVPALLIAVGLHLHPGLLHRLMRRVGVDVDALAEADRPRRTVGSMLTDAGVALGIGAGLVIIRRRWVEPHRSLASDLRTGAIACVLVAVVSGLIGYLIAGGIHYAADIGLERPAQLVVDYAADWRFWLVVVVLVQGVPWAVRRLRSRGD